MKGTNWVIKTPAVILAAAAVFFACQSLFDPPPESTLELDAPLPRQIAQEHNTFLAKVFEKEAEWNGMGKAAVLKTTEGRLQLLEESGREYLQGNPHYSEVNVEKVVAASQQFIKTLEDRNNQLLLKKASDLSNMNSLLDTADPPGITGEEFVRNILAIKVETGAINERVRTALLELIQYQQQAGMTVSTTDLQDYAEKEILSKDWSEEEKQQLAIALAVHRASSEFWSMKQLTEAEMAKIGSPESVQSWCSYLTMWADAGGAMIGGGAALPFVGASVGVAVVAGGYTSYLYKRFVCS